MSTGSKQLGGDDGSKQRLTDCPPLEIFLPSYIDCDYVPLENRRDPVHEIHLTDEEMKNMLPQ